MRHLDIKIYGRVQGVFFRDSTLKKALDLGIRGFIKNEPDGGVYIEAEAEKEKLEEFLDWCHQGPSWAEVRKINFQYTGLKDFNDFVIKY